MQFTAVAWNLFHGRDFPPDRSLFTWRSRLLRVEERNETHMQVNRELLDEFAAILAGAPWDVALLQEAPPRWAAPLARACEADAQRVLTSRNSFGALRAAAARLNPDLVASAEGGSNLTLVRRRGALGGIVERRAVVIHCGRPERRTMALSRTAAGPCVANLHATNDRPPITKEDVTRAAQAATGWAGEAPLLFGGDLNLRPAREPELYASLAERWGIGGPAIEDGIDQLLGRGLESVRPPAQWPPERRELRRDGLALRLSDHAPVEARFAVGSPGKAAG